MDSPDPQFSRSHLALFAALHFHGHGLTQLCRPATPSLPWRSDHPNANGVELKISLSDIGSPALGSIDNLQFFATQADSTKGAFDTVPSDEAQDITHDFFAEMRPYVKGSNGSGTVYGDSEQLMLGEVTRGCDWCLPAVQPG